MAKKPAKSQKHPPDEEEIEKQEPEEVPAEEEKEEGEAPPEEAPVPEEALAENEGQEAGEPVPPAGSHKIQIIGDGSLSLLVDGKAESFERGSTVKVSTALMEALEASGIPFKKVKS